MAKPLDVSPLQIRIFYVIERIRIAVFFTADVFFCNLSVTPVDLFSLSKKLIAEYPGPKLLYVQF